MQTSLPFYIDLPKSNFLTGSSRQAFAGLTIHSLDLQFTSFFPFFFKSTIHFNLQINQSAFEIGLKGG